MELSSWWISSHVSCLVRGDIAAFFDIYIFLARSNSYRWTSWVMNDEGNVNSLEESIGI